MTASTDDAPIMSRRSWYMNAAVADRLAEAVDELHWSTRRPKHEVLAAAVAVALDDPDAIQARLMTGPEGTR
jgi:predicted transcriptional regulator